MISDPSAEEIVDKATDAATEYAGDYISGEIKDTWAGDAADTVKQWMGGDVGGAGGGGWLSKVKD